GTGKKKILLTASIHGREYVTTGFLLCCAEEYALALSMGEYYGVFDIRRAFSEYSFYFVPLANPDSVETALLRGEPFYSSNILDRSQNKSCKNNANNVNLNANFPYFFEYVPKERQGGPFAGSERETRFLISLCENHRFEALLSFHSRGNCIYYRDSGNGAIKGDFEIAKLLSIRCGFSLCYETENIESYSGGFENWFRHRFRRPGLCVELITDENADFLRCCEDFYTLANWEKTRFAPLCAM
ncbi:MAG: M14 family zinc carboxypeptidase, partial [Ruminococcus sp.]